ncbi:MAG: SIMPL domain-containing protein [Methanomicrobiaceae archaeon]|nr:SIMPL domain-containing protein [Methanomicrobiaceae archaeon]
MKSRFFIVAFVMLIAMAALIGSASAADEKLIQVSGTGKVTTDPDIVEVSIAVQTENPDALVAQQENAEKMNDCISALKALGFTDDELKTTGYSMYSYTTSSDSPFGKDKKVYRVTNTLVVETGQTDMAGKIVDTAIANGANNVNYISFKLSDEKSQMLRSEALTKAVLQARSDADSVASALGVSIMGVQNVNVGASYTPYTYAETSYKSVAMDSAGGLAPTPIQADTVDVTASVSISYIIR